MKIRNHYQADAKVLAQTLDLEIYYHNSGNNPLYRVSQRGSSFFACRRERTLSGSRELVSYLRGLADAQDVLG